MTDQLCKECDFYTFYNNKHTCCNLNGRQDLTVDTTCGKWKLKENNCKTDCTCKGLCVDGGDCSCGDVCQKTIILIQQTINSIKQKSNTFISTWKTDNLGGSENNQIRLSLVSSGNYDFIVYWGDGSQDTITDWDDLSSTHTYSAPGTYEVIIDGQIMGWSFNDSNDAPKILEIKQWGSMGFGDTRGQFNGCINLTVSATDMPDLSETICLARAFESCKALTTVPSMDNWDTSNVTDMSWMFRGANTFDQDISNWNTSSVTDMSWMFSYAAAFNQDISNWDTSNVTNMSWMFSYVAAFNQDVSGWDTSSVTNMSSMFSFADSFDQDLSGWNISSVTDMSSMFSFAAAFDQDISNWNTSNVKNMSWMFHAATAFNQDLTGWDTSDVTNMSNMFYGAAAFNGDVSGWDTSHVTDMGWMFLNAAAFNQDISNWDTSSVIDMGNMFYSAAIFNGNISNWDTSNVTNMSSMFQRALSFDQNLFKWNISKVTNMYNMFADICLSTVNYDAILIGWERQSIKSGITFNGGCSQYTTIAAVNARARLAANYGWVISDGGMKQP